jgi:hypothetical protein
MKEKPVDERGRPAPDGVPDGWLPLSVFGPEKGRRLRRREGVCRGSGQTVKNSGWFVWETIPENPRDIQGNNGESHCRIRLRKALRIPSSHSLKADLISGKSR